MMGRSKLLLFLFSALLFGNRGFANIAISSDTIQLDENPGFPSGISVFDPPPVNLGNDRQKCEGDTLNATVPGNATYLWQDGSTNPILKVRQTGVYKVTVTVDDMSASDSVLITVKPLPTLDLGADTTLCRGDSLRLNLVDVGGFIVWPDGSTGPTYVVTTTTQVWAQVIKDGCVASDTIRATFVPKPPLELGADRRPCEGQPVQLNATVPGPVTYRWNDGSTAPTLNVTQSGRYSVSVTDRGCTVKDSVLVTFKPVPVVELGKDTTLCSGDSLRLDLSSTIADGSFILWPDGSTGPTFTVRATTKLWVSVIKDGCTASDTINVTFLATPPVELGPDRSLCAGQSTELNATVPGSATYLWGNGSTQPRLTVSQTGLYSVTVTNQICRKSDAVQVTFLPLPVVDLGPADTLVCGQTSLQLSLSGVAGTITWPDGSTGPTFTATRSGSVQVQVTQNNCTATDAINITLQPLPPLDLGPPSREVCQGESVVLNATVPGNATYQWQDGNTQPSRTLTQGGLYRVTVSANGCSAQDEVQLTVNPLPVVDLGPADTLVCGQTSLQLSLSGVAGTITWPDGSNGPTFTATSNGNVQVQVTQNNCTATDAINITLQPLPPLDLGPPSREICQGESVVLNATVPGNAAYQWQDGLTQPSRTLTQSGQYRVTVTANGCSAQDEVQLTVNPLPVFNLGPADTLVCGQTSLQLSLSGVAGTITWPDGSTGTSFTVRNSGLVQVRVTQNNCTTIDSMRVNFGSTPNLELGEEVNLCQQEPYLIRTQDPNATYRWSDGSTNSSLLVNRSGVYWVVASNNGCTVSDTVKVTLTAPLTVDIGNQATPCENEVLTLDAGNPGATYLWQDGSRGRTFAATRSGLYWVEVRQGACVIRDSADLAFKMAPEVDLGGDIRGCEGIPVQLNPFISMADEVRWQDGSSGFTFEAGQDGLYWVEAVAGGCRDRDSVRVTFEAPPTVNLGGDRSVCNNELLILRAGTSRGTIRWQDGSIRTSFPVDKPGAYWVNVQEGLCSVSDTITVTFLPCGIDNIYIPTAFSPNEDDINDIFRPFIHPDYEVLSYELNIFNRWGGLLFQSFAVEDGWDGSYRNQPVQTGVYVYLIKITFRDGEGEKEDLLAGDVTVFR